MMLTAICRTFPCICTPLFRCVLVKIQCVRASGFNVSGARFCWATCEPDHKTELRFYRSTAASGRSHERSDSMRSGVRILCVRRSTE